MKKFLTIGEGIERGIAAIDAGEIKWGRGRLYNRHNGSMCVVGAAALMENRAGGIQDIYDYQAALCIHTTHSFLWQIQSANDDAPTWEEAKKSIRHVLKQNPTDANHSPAREAYEATLAKVMRA